MFKPSSESRSHFAGIPVQYLAGARSACRRPRRIRSAMHARNIHMFRGSAARHRCSAASRDSHRSARGSSRDCVSIPTPTTRARGHARIRGTRACTYRTFDGCRPREARTRVEYSQYSPPMARLLPGEYCHLSSSQLARIPNRTESTRARCSRTCARTSSIDASVRSLSSRDKRI